MSRVAYRAVVIVNWALLVFFAAGFARGLGTFPSHGFAVAALAVTAVLALGFGLRVGAAVIALALLWAAALPMMITGMLFSGFDGAVAPPGSYLPLWQQYVLFVAIWLAFLPMGVVTAKLVGTPWRSPAAPASPSIETDVDVHGPDR